MWDYIKLHSLQDPTDKRFVLPDERLEPILGGKKRISMFAMQKFLAKHMMTKEEVSGVEGTEKPRKKKAPAGKTVFSSALKEFLGVTEPIKRTAIVSALWAHIRKHDLQDPSDRRMILCDDKLKSLFGGAERVSSFGMNKLISAHITVEGNGEADATPTPKSEPNSDPSPSESSEEDSDSSP